MKRRFGCPLFFPWGSAPNPPSASRPSSAAPKCFCLYLVCAALVAPAVAACADREPPPESLTARLPPGVVARVADSAISARTVERIATAQGLAPAAARERAIEDALFARAARAALPRDLSASAERAVLARALLEELLRQARAQGPVTQAELDAIIRERWYELDRPKAVRTTHAVVMPKPGEEAKAAALAEAIRRSASGAKDASDFRKRAESVDEQGLTVRVEQLPFITADGRSFQQDALRPPSEGTSYDLDFARAASAIAEVGGLSPVTKTPFGYHVIYLEERLPEHRLTPEQARALLGEEAIAKRAARAEAALVKELQAKTVPEVARAADELTARVPTSR